MNNEPIAYGMFKDDEFYDAIHPKQYTEHIGSYTIPLFTHPVKELHLSLQKDKETGELLAVTYTDDEHRIVEVLWQRPPVKEHFEDEPQAEELHEILQSNAELTLTDEEWKLLDKVINNCEETIEYRIDVERLAFKGYEHCSELEILYEEQKDASKARAILRKAQEK